MIFFFNEVLVCWSEYEAFKDGSEFDVVLRKWVFLFFFGFLSVYIEMIKIGFGLRVNLPLNK